MKLLQDIIGTWKISRRPGSNYRATHAGGAVVVGFILVLVSLWFLLLEWPDLYRSGILFILGIFFLLYWRYLLPEAMWRSKIQEMREAAKVKHLEGKNSDGA